MRFIPDWGGKCFYFSKMFREGPTVTLTQSKSEKSPSGRGLWAEDDSGTLQTAAGAESSSFPAFSGHQCSLGLSKGHTYP